MSAKEVEQFKRPELFLNRELSWLEFNHRVLDMAVGKTNPPLERMKFLAIFASNLDEFFMIRVAGLLNQLRADVKKTDPSGLTVARQMDLVVGKVRELIGQHAEAVRSLIGELRQQGLVLLRRHEWNADQRRYLKEYFQHTLMPNLTPLAVQELSVCPLLPGLQLHIGITLEAAGDAPNPILVIPSPTSFARFITLPAQEATCVVAIEDIIADNASMFCGDKKIQSVDFFRITRDADVSIREDEADDLLVSMEEAVLERRRRGIVRAEISAGSSEPLQRWIGSEFELDDKQFYPIDGLLDVRGFWELVFRSGLDHLRWEDWPSQKPRDLAGYDSIWEAVNDHDVMLYHPYETFDPVVELIQKAAEDPNVLAIKQTLYRTSPESPIIDALVLAAEKGKEVTVLVELKARFDEARNVRWARRLEDAGCYVIYGVVGLKTHAKALLIVRRESGRIKRYVHLSTGNYNDKTAKLYSDIGLLTCDNVMAADVSSFFNLLTGFSELTKMSKLVIAPTNLRRRLLELIEREIRAGSVDRPGNIIIKANSLEDKDICRALYKAAASGVQIRLNIRGICCLRPGIKGVSENIEVISILDRYLEHARIYYFSNGGHPEVYLSSADMMGRNLDRRLETFFPITSNPLKDRLYDILLTCFSDNTNAWRLCPEGSYEPLVPEGQPVRSQQVFYEQARDVTKAQKNQFRFRPIRQSEK
jgi:polyphosphate kinase